MDKMSRLIETIRTLMEGEFSGHIRINFTQGSLGRIEKSEEFDAKNVVAMDAALRKTGEKKKVSHEL